MVNGVAAVNVIDTGKDLKIRIRFTTVQPIAAARGSCGVAVDTVPVIP